MVKSREYFSRRSGARAVSVAIAVMFASTALVACSASDPAPTDDGAVESLGSITVAYAGGAYNAHIKLAEQQGMFAAHGIETVEYLPVTGGVASTTALVSGSVDFANASPPSLLGAVTEGNDLVYLMNSWTKPMELIVRPEIAEEAASSYPESIEALKGRTIGIVARGGSDEAYFRIILDDAGMQESDVTFVAVGFGPTAIAAFAAGQIDALVAFTPYTVLLEPDTFVPLVDADTTASDVFGTVPLQAGFATSRQLIEDQPELVAAFCDAMWDAQEFARDDANLETLTAFSQAEVGTFTDDQAAVFAKEYQQYFDLGLPEELWSKQGATLPEGLSLPDYDDQVLESCATPR